MFVSVILLFLLFFKLYSISKYCLVYYYKLKSSRMGTCQVMLLHVMGQTKYKYKMVLLEFFPSLNLLPIGSLHK